MHVGVEGNDLKKARGDEYDEMLIRIEVVEEEA